jgi:hypothetical protein
MVKHNHNVEKHPAAQSHRVFKILQN